MKAVTEHMTPDYHGTSTVRNMYFDTPDSRLIRTSIEKPVYKEKFRIRGYCTADENTTVFAEIKKKYRSVVYKRRVEISWQTAENFYKNGGSIGDSQIAREIEYFFSSYGELRPAMFISYDRAAFYDGEFKATFDDNILYRRDNISLALEPDGERLLPEGYTLMELKTPEAVPLWMTRVLTENKIYKTSFSKYGEAYMRQMKEGDKNEQYI